MNVRPITTRLLQQWPLPGLSPHDTKEDRGRILIIGGSLRVPGAVLLAGIASLRSGAGKLQVATSHQAALSLAVALPEAKVTGIGADAKGEVSKLPIDVAREAQEADAVLVGPGMNPTTATLRIAATVMQRAASVVLDAGAVGASASPRRGAVVLTPHLGEMARLIDMDADRIAADLVPIARTFAREWNATLVLKGADTVVANAEGDAWMHAGGCVGLATSGSGDVLAGVITGLLAQGATPHQAAVWGVALHARAGEELSRRVGAVGFLAREIADAVPRIRLGFGNEKGNEGS